MEERLSVNLIPKWSGLGEICQLTGACRFLWGGQDFCLCSLDWLLFIGQRYCFK